VRRVAIKKTFMIDITIKIYQLGDNVSVKIIGEPSWHFSDYGSAVEFAKDLTDIIAKSLLKNSI